MRDLVQGVMRLFFFAAGLVLAFLLLALGLVLGVALLVWRMLRGRQPQWQFHRMRPGAAAWRGVPPRQGGARHGARDGEVMDAEVIDVQVREVGAPPRSPDAPR